jgi:hypothetical protein
MRRRNCDQCGRVYEAKASTSRYCGSGCRARASEGIPPSVADAGVVPLPSPAESSGELASSIRRTLTDAGRLDTWQGQAALSIAARIDAGEDSGSAIAALQRELRATMVEAMRGVGAPRSAVSAMRDELAARRRRGSA